jgi:hypothetical protein
VKKQVEQHENTIVNTYEGTHNHPQPELDSNLMKKRRKMENEQEKRRAELEEELDAEKLENEAIKLWEQGQLPSHARNCCRWELCQKQFFTFEGFMLHVKREHIRPQANKRGRARTFEVERPRKGFYCLWDNCPTTNKSRHGQRELQEHVSAKHLKFLRCESKTKMRKRENSFDDTM